MIITVAICTWNRAHLLDQTLARMRQLAIPDGVTWELLVVNNNSTDQTDDVVAKHSDALPIRLLHEPRQGHSHARNCAVAAAKGELLVWTDDDVLVSPTWLCEYVSAARAWPDAAYFGGQVVPWFEVSPPGWAVRHRNRIGYCWAVIEREGTVRRLADQEYVVGANMAFRTEVLRGLEFDPTLGRVGDQLISGEETAVQDALRRVGRYGVWVGTATVQHWVPANRLRLDYIWKFHFDGALASARKERWNEQGPRWFGVPRWLVRRYLWSSVLDLTLRPFQTVRWLEAFLERAKWSGFMAAAKLDRHPTWTHC